MERKTGIAINMANFSKYIMVLQSQGENYKPEYPYLTLPKLILLENKLKAAQQEHMQHLIELKETRNLHRNLLNECKKGNNKIDELNKSSIQVIQKRNLIQKVIQKRNHLLSASTYGIVDITRNIKRSVRLEQGRESAFFQALNTLKFTKPRTRPSLPSRNEKN